MYGSENKEQSTQIAGLSRDASKPLYSQLAEELREKIQSGQWSEGTKLPPERSLCSMYEVSRITVRHAISQLENDGLVSRLQGLGTFVSTVKYEQPLAEIHSFELAMQKLGYVASTRIHHKGTIVGDLLLANALQLDVSETIKQLQIVGLGGGSPIVFYDSYFSDKIGSLIHNAAEERSRMNLAFSTLDLYRENLGITLLSAEQTFESMVSDHDLSKVLEVPEGTPILKVTSIINGSSGPLEYRRAFYRGDKYKFFVQRDLVSGSLS